MEIIETSHGAILVLKPIGALVDADASAFRDRTLDAAARSLGRVVVDASAIPFVDSAGVEALLDVTEELADGGRALKLCTPVLTLKQVLELTDCISAFEIYDDVPLAVRSFL